VQPQHREAVARIRELIRRRAPGVTELISHVIPAYWRKRIRQRSWIGLGSAPHVTDRGRPNRAISPLSKSVIALTRLPAKVTTMSSMP
jgi:hypothetical protein